MNESFLGNKTYYTNKNISFKIKIQVSCLCQYLFFLCYLIKGWCLWQKI